MNLINFVLWMFVLQPFVEYWLHRLAHHFRVNMHVEHHHIYKGKQYSKYAGHMFAWCIIMCFLALKQWVLAFAVLKYEIMHTLTHHPLHYMYRHHFMHHHNPQCNFGVSACWPDYVFGTLRYE